jgi:ABC-type lipoprotein export system ATPase subunit
VAQPNLLLKTEQVRKAYVMGTATIEVLRGASMSVAPGEFVAVMGASGSGKSTLLHILGGLDLPDGGRVIFDGQSIFDMSTRQRDRHRNVAVGFVFQFYHLLPELNVLENVLLPRMVGTSILGWRLARGAAREAAMQAIERVNMQHRLDHRPNELSGGERQRVAIARALVTRPRLLLADEPTGNLDAQTGKEILSVLARLNAQGQTIVMVTHDPNVAALAHRSLLLSEGVVHEQKQSTRALVGAPNP